MARKSDVDEVRVAKSGEVATRPASPRFAEMTVTVTSRCPLQRHSSRRYPQRWTPLR